MAIMMARLYRALRTAEVPEDQAREAAEEIAGFESMRTELQVVKWICGFNTVLGMATVGMIIQLLLRH